MDRRVLHLDLPVSPRAIRRLRRLALLLLAAPLALACNGAHDVEAREAAVMTGGGDPARGPDLMRKYGCQSCHTHQSCTERCPKHLTPTASIASLKRRVAIAAIKGSL